MYKKWQVIAGIVINVIIILVISQLATGSLNPIEVFKGEKTLFKIVVGFFLFTILMAFIQLLIIHGLRDKTCAKCGKSLTDFAGAYGNPVKCRFCNRWFHTMCLRSEGGSPFTGCKQPGCPSAGIGLDFPNSAP